MDTQPSFFIDLSEHFGELLGVVVAVICALIGYFAKITHANQSEIKRLNSVTAEALDRHEREADARIDKIEARITTLEVSLREVVTHADLIDIRDRLSTLCGEHSGISRQLDVLQTDVRKIIQR
uniref:Uncharacterized protein n=1 Tax=Candidatus Kentrum sp. FM TaxID=2126340 RepID=A0A450RXB7_9GAMM|nr:MAG: hypothetical protein BECKFM1743A_GA0114220_1000321 [Candidatus Kentron sp. FM]VFJ43665.1 MAG: hypothetical protein BECKFM1743C_GA0114222_1000321 [Candidatus Kentron sp. FM]VFK05660.1 MAG: hypothetical protein BECKFM1743B_GA0114221_1000321 [Candidatus Kentron sp. FM]